MRASLFLVNMITENPEKLVVSVNTLTMNVSNHIETRQLLCKPINWFLHGAEHWSLIR